MDQEPGASEDKPKPPPPDLPKTPPPPTPPAPPSPPPPTAPPEEQTPAQPLQIGPSSDSGGGGPAAEAPGTDASMGNRVIATVIDSIIMAGIYVGAAIILPDFAEGLGGLAAIAYLLTRDSLPFLDGQSVGKKAMRIRAVRSDSEKPLTGDWQPGVIRNAVLLIPFFALVELIVLITRQDKPPPLLRLGDEWARTKVVNVAPEALSGED